MLLNDFNSQAHDLAVRQVGVWAAIDSWAEAVAAARPYRCVDEAAAQAEALSQSWTADDLDAALAHHPRIGQKPTGDGAGAQASRSEQAAVSDAGSDTRAAIAVANADYEARFGRVFLVRAAGRTGPEILAEAHRRLTNDERSEIAEALQALREIAALRLRSDLTESGAEDRT